MNNETQTEQQKTEAGEPVLFGYFDVIFSRQKPLSFKTIVEPPEGYFYDIVHWLNHSSWAGGIIVGCYDMGSFVHLKRVTKPTNPPPANMRDATADVEILSILGASNKEYGDMSWAIEAFVSLEEDKPDPIIGVNKMFGWHIWKGRAVHQFNL